ncbi:hypothetical protein BJV82DRAFT_705469, partial [Fennellomyces sp. T-0311]
YEVIGYARKSTTSDTENTRVSLLQLMVNKLIYRGLAEKVFVSPYADATSEIQTRDHQKYAILNKLKYCDGNMNDLIRRLHCQQKKIRLVILDYAGLATNVEEVKHFVRYVVSIDPLKLSMK